MAEEVKDEQIEETTSDETSDETSQDEGSSVEESSSDVVTEPTVEGEQPTADYVQLEQRVTSLEQRLLSVEQPAPAPVESGSDPNGEPEVAEESEGTDGDSREEDSTDDIKKMLDL